MNMTVHNLGLNVGDIKITAVAASSIFLVGDSDQIHLSSFFDTPPESYIVGIKVPLAPPVV